MHTLLSAPAHIKREFLGLCQSYEERTSFSERVAIGVIAHSAGDFWTAIQWFQSARSLDADRLEPLAGQAACFADLARQRCGPVISAPEFSPRLLLHSSYM
jgi:hypothetical protein